MPKVDLIHNPIIQSPYTYLQAAGSDGTDKTVIGNHLRWDFLKSLGDNHLAKGNYTISPPYISASGFNRTNDFIKIMRAKFKANYFTKIDFNVSQTTVINTGTTRAWQYAILVDSLTGVTTNVTVRFTDYTQYDIIRASQTTFNTISLLNAYTGIVEIETNNKLAFYADFDVKTKPATNGYIRIESVTIPDTSDFSQKQVSCRKKFVGTPATKIISCENIQYLRFDYFKAEWKEIKVYCYEDYITGINSQNQEGGWDNVGDFSLTTDDLIARNRFKPNDVDGAGGHWPKFNDDNPTTGEFTINKHNYFNRWRRPTFTFDPSSIPGNDLNSLQYFIHKYMEISTTDERALASIPSDDLTDSTTQDISYVDMIRLMSLDFHVARMLGLGHIDDDRQLIKNSYIYCLEYKTFEKLEAPYTTSAERTHIYMTIPVSTADYRLPAIPNLSPLTYGISVDNGTPTPTLLTDALGYAPFGNIRFININRGPFNFEKPFGPFYYDPTEFCLCDETQPVAYGLEYKEISELTNRKPEINHDVDYVDASGLPETIPILEGGTPKIFTHQEVEEGTHEYRSYAINWFSRVSPLSNKVTAITAFPKQSHLLPPFNFAVQLIQDEDPAETVIANKALILTTETEQGILAIIPPANDKTLVRTTFDWNHVHHHAHQYADYADVLFRRNEPLIVKGKISSVSLLSGNRAQITTTSYAITSVFPSTNVVPTISTGDSTKFVGSFFSSAGDNYIIESIISSGANPTFIIGQIKQINAVADPSNPGQFISNETFKSPTPSDLFFTAENMGALSNWDIRHSKRIYLEKFYSNAKVKLRFSPTHAIDFEIKSLSIGGGGNTKIEVEKPINTVFVAGLTLEYAVKHEIVAIAANTFIISGDSTTDFTSGKPFRVFANKNNDGLYSVNTSSYALGNTTIITNEPIPFITNIDGLIEIVVSRSVTAINSVANTFRITGNKIAEINVANIEYKLENDGTYTRFVIGGIKDTVTFEPFLTTPPPVSPTSSILPEGTGFIQLKFQNYNLLPHPDSEVSWYKGTVRLKDVLGKVQVYPVTYIGNLTSTTTTHLAIVIQDPGFVPMSAQTGPLAADIYTLDLNLIQSANFHPGYKLYLSSDNGINPTTGISQPLSGTNFDSDDILPLLTDPNEGSRQTYMSIRSYDIKNDLESFLSNPVVLLAQKISLPIPPSQPKGPLYATRPDYYGKSTYSFDTELNRDLGRIPYSVVFYRSSEDIILDALYRKSTQAIIWEQLNLLSDPKAKFDPLLWQVLFEGDNGPNSPSVTNPGIPPPPVGFKTYKTTAGEFTWPLPDNDGGIGLVIGSLEQILESHRGGYIFPFEAVNSPSAVFKPFVCNAVTGVPMFDLSANYLVYGKLMSAKDILKKAISSAFLPLNEQAPLFNYFKQGTLTSSAKAKFRDASGNLLDPLTNDIFPMIRILNDLPGTETVVRYTDYTLDGASKSLYFYRALEMDDKFKFSESSLPVGPVLMVNAFPPDKPQIRKIITKLQNTSSNTPSSVLFEINEYSENQKISKVEIYRATNEIDALSIRTMKRAKSITWGMPLIDDFSDVAFPLYGETLHYRIIAIREIEDVEDVLLAPPLLPLDPTPTVIIDFPSLPSDISKAGIVDVINPSAPKLYSQNGTTTLTELQNVILKWNSTCYNGTYRLQKLNASGNWVQIYSEKVTDIPMQYPPLDLSNFPDFTNFPETQILPRVDVDGNAIYHRFRVQVENSSGLFNLTEFEITLAKGASDLQEFDSVLSFADATSHNLSVLKTSDIITGASQPNSMTFTHLNNALPAGHNSFTSIDITVTDDLSNTQTIPITIAGNTATFDNLTAPTLDLISPNRKYTIKTKLLTDFVTPAGLPISPAVQIFTISYLTGPCYDLKQITNLVKLTDSTHNIDPMISGNINDGVAYPTTLKFTDIVNLTSIAQTFSHIEIVVTDDLTNTATKTISAAGNDVTFTVADGLALDNTNPNRNYEIKTKIFTAECATGNELTYNISYTYTPCDDITTLTGIAKLTDNNGTIINPIANQTISSVTHPNGSITIQELISGSLPSLGHTFVKMDVILEDDLGGAFIKTINAVAGTVTFNNGEGSLVLDNSNPHRTYFVTSVLYTSQCSNGASYTFTIKY
jgi:hypothetical protein